ncbi:Zinc dependent phospholipase C [Lachnospiraceae bacterium XBB1006]|nr:Zinc dependent phospholipase C [Lachnospiraceae bacterium XBB1006]
MPGFYTHYLFGAMTFPGLRNQHTKDIIRDNKSVYTFGLQGPDFLFYFLPSQIIHRGNLGSTMHERRTGCFLFHLLNTCTQFTDPEDRAIAECYILGFLGHYTLDSVAHPYIYDRSGFVFQKTQKYYSRHIELETEIDSEMLDYYKHRKPSAFAQHKLLTLTSKQKKVISACLTSALQQTYPEYFLHSALMRMALRWMQIGTHLFYDKNGWKKPLVRNLENKIFGYYPISFMIPTDTPSDFIDSTNVLKETWKNPWNPTKQSNESFYELFERAQNEYRHLITATEEVFNASRQTLPSSLRKWKELVGNRSYHSGLSCEL